MMMMILDDDPLIQAHHWTTTWRSLSLLVSHAHEHEHDFIAPRTDFIALLRLY